MQDLVPQPGIKPRPPAWGPWSLSHWTIKEVPSWIIQTLPRVMLGDYLTSLFQSSFPFTSVISNMGLIRDSIGDCEWDIFPALRTVWDTERKGGRNKRDKGKEKERKLQGERKRRKRWQRKDGGSRETERRRQDWERNMSLKKKKQNKTS